MVDLHRKEREEALDLKAETRQRKRTKTKETDQEITLFLQAGTGRAEGEGAEETGQSFQACRLCSGHRHNMQKWPMSRLSINWNWREVKIWDISVTARLSHEDRPYPFSVPDEDVGVNVDHFRRMHKRDPFHVLSEIYWKDRTKAPNP